MHSLHYQSSRSEKESINTKLKAFEELEKLKKEYPIDADLDKEREEAMNEKYGIID